MAARDCSFEYFRACTKNVNEPATSLQLGHNSCNWVKTLAAVCCKFSGSCNRNFLRVVFVTAVILYF
jgi:hypothetical protein